MQGTGGNSSSAFRPPFPEVEVISHECRGPAKLLVVDTDSGKTVDAVDCVGDTDDVWYDDDARRVYVSGGEGFVSDFSRAEGGRLKPLAKVPCRTGGGPRAEIRVFATW